MSNWFSNQSTITKIILIILTFCFLPMIISDLILNNSNDSLELKMNDDIVVEENIDEKPKEYIDILETSINSNTQLALEFQDRFYSEILEKYAKALDNLAKEFEENDAFSIRSEQQAAKIVVLMLSLTYVAEDAKNCDFVPDFMESEIRPLLVTFEKLTLNYKDALYSDINNFILYTSESKSSKILEQELIPLISDISLVFKSYN